MPKKEPVLRYKGQSSSAVGTRSTISASLEATDHGLLLGLTDDDHPQYAAIAQDETITGDWTVTGELDVSGGTFTLPTAAPDADSVNVSVSGEGSNASYSRSDHTHNLDEAIAPTWTSGHTFEATTSMRDVLPQSNDAYDLGDSTHWWNQMFVSQINAAVFAEEQITLLGGWLYVSHDAGTFAVDVETSDTTVDFGKAMTQNDFVVIKAYDASDTIKTEYMQVGTLVTGTEYNVTRDLASAHGTDPNWVAGTPFAVLGQTGDGRIELNAYDAPRIQIFTQDDATTYSNTTEYLRIGEMNGSYGSDAANEWGLGVGDYSNGDYMTFNTTDGFSLGAGGNDVTMNTNGINIYYDTGDAQERLSFYEKGGASDPNCYIQGIIDTSAGSSAFLVVNRNNGDTLSAETRLTGYDADGTYGSCSAFFKTTHYEGVSLEYPNMEFGISNYGSRIVSGANSTDYGVLFGYEGDVMWSLLRNSGKTAFQQRMYSTTVAHGITDEVDTDVFGIMRKSLEDAGGLFIGGYRDSDGSAGFALNLHGNLGEAADTTHSASGVGVVNIAAQVTNGSTGLAAVGTNGNVLSIRNYTNTVAIFDAEGDLHLDGSTSSYDEFDDASAIQSLAQGLAQKWNSTLEFNFDKLRDMGVISGGTPDRPFVSTKRLNALLMGAIGQLYDRVQQLERMVT